MRAGSMRVGVVLVVLGLLAVVLGGQRAVGQPCEPEWADERFALPGASGTVSTSLLIDTSQGRKLIAAGWFFSIGESAGNTVAAWDGQRWQGLGDQIRGSVNSMVYFDDGSGAAIYASGDVRIGSETESRTGVVRWDGARWHRLGDGIGEPGAMCVYDAGDGPRLYVAGRVTVGGAPAIGIARWSEGRWEPIGVTTSLSGPWVHALAVYDDGHGPVLVAGGTFQSIDGVAARSLAAWNGSQWREFGDGVSGLRGSVRTLAVAAVDGEEALYVGGNFVFAGTQRAPHLARWRDGWTPLGGLNGEVWSLAVHDDGDGAALYAGGDFTRTGLSDIALNHVAKWTGQQWTPLANREGIGLDGTVRTLASVPTDQGQLLFIGGSFETIVGPPRRRVRFAVFWDGRDWIAAARGLDLGVHAIQVYDDGDGPMVYAGGDFISDGVSPLGRFARLNGDRWEAVGPGFDNSVGAMEVFDDGRGESLYVAGSFRRIGVMPARSIARWDGRSWEPLARGINQQVLCLRVFDDGRGAALYAGGVFTFAGDVPAENIARWDGTSWEALGQGVDGRVYDMVVHDDGSGPALYAVGNFRSAGGSPANNIARWNGDAWSTVGDGVGDRFGDQALAAASFDDGSGPALYVGGRLEGGSDVEPLVRWDGAGWSHVGEGLQRGPGDTARVSALAVADDGRGPALFALGSMWSSGATELNNIARWDGTSWTPLGTGIGERGEVLAVGPNRDLFAGGEFLTAGDATSAHIARWGCPPAPCRADLDGDGQLTMFDFRAYQNLFDAGDPRADFDGDGTLTLFDFLAFQNAFDAGCP